MASTLGTASLILTTSTQGLTNGLGKAKGIVTSGVKGITSSIGGAFKGIGSSLSSVIGGGLKGIATGATIGVASAVGTKLLEGITSPFERIGDIAKQGQIATSLGLTPEQFTGIAGAAKAAGSDTKDFLEGLITLSSRGREALSGTSEVAASMFSKLNLSASEFVQLNPEQQFYKLFESLNAVKNPAEQVDLLLKAFGEDTGKNLVGLLGKSTDELKAQAAQYALNSEQVARAQLASEAFSEAQAKIGRAFDDVVIALAPLIQTIGQELSKAVGQSGGNFSKFGNVVLSVIKHVAKATGTLIDIWDKARNAADAFVGQGAVIIGKAIGDDALVEGGRQVRDQGWNDLMNKPFGQNAKAVDEFFAKFEANLNTNNTDLVKRIDKLNNPGKMQQQNKAEISGVEAALKGSAQAAAIIARFDAEGDRQTDVQRRQLQAQMQVVGLLSNIKDNLAAAPLLNVF